MEDSAKRKERLLALRQEASAAAASSSSQSPVPTPEPPDQSEAELPNPILHSSSAISEASSTQTARFDYYTNPTAAFSGSANHKRKSGYYNYTPSSPSPIARPNFVPRNYTGTYRPPVHQFHSPFTAPLRNQWRSPVQFQPPIPGYQVRTPIGGLSPRTGPINSPFVRGGNHSTNDRPRPNPNPNPNYYFNPRGSSGRGQGFYNRFNRDIQGDYYNKSMVVDPWEELEPIVGNIIEPMHGSKSWLPKSLTNKTETKSDQSGIKSKSNLSLAEYLDLSFNQAIEE